MLKAQGLAEGQILQAKAQAGALKSIEDQLKTLSGSRAAQFLLAQQQIEAVRKLAREDTTLIVTKDFSSVKQQVAEMTHVLTRK